MTVRLLPGNAHNKNNFIQGVEFTEEETMELLKHKDGEPYTDWLATKLKAAGISAWTHVLPRNLAVLLQNINL